MMVKSLFMMVESPFMLAKSQFSWFKPIVSPIFWPLQIRPCSKRCCAARRSAAGQWAKPWGGWLWKWWLPKTQHHGLEVPFHIENILLMVGKYVRLMVGTKIFEASLVGTKNHQWIGLHRSFHHWGTP